MYVLNSSVFKLLKHHIDNNLRVGGDIQLTPVLSSLCTSQQVKGLMVHGKRFDMGNPESVFEALAAFRAK